MLGQPAARLYIGRARGEAHHGMRSRQHPTGPRRPLVACCLLLVLLNLDLRPATLPEPVPDGQSSNQEHRCDLWLDLGRQQSSFLPPSTDGQELPNEAPRAHLTDGHRQYTSARLAVNPLGRRSCQPLVGSTRHRRKEDRVYSDAEGRPALELSCDHRRLGRHGWVQLDPAERHTLCGRLGPT